MADLIDSTPESYLNLENLDTYVRLLPKELKPEGYEPWLVAFAAINNFVWTVRAAEKKSREAVSWRNYKVGAAVLAYNFEVPSMGIMLGANVKLSENDATNIHAEQMAMAKARRNNLDHIISVAVFGDPTDADANPSSAPTLRPCRRCSNMFAEAPEVKPETLIVSANSDFSVCEMYSAAELAAYYENPDASCLVSNVPPYSLGDNLNDSEYTSEVLIPYLIPKVLELYQPL